ncbi:tRNA lysidine(34) synthetase TilS [Dyadobacter crusticola]|uniref:tRNA lysidine(34) synthetase TilS n=1 Tax=Dyadobacter crusticola TaxID=292407 RepID=UPI000689D78C|nr:tRNA lysidine(34) synthetase TilS [Dyadobacter crusticola]
MDSFLTFINQQGWDFNAQRSLLAVSGGVDSMVLMHLFHKHGFQAGVAHCNFGLRGEESDEDERYVRQKAYQYGFEFFVKTFDTKAFAKQKSVSTQMAARELRYKWFEDIRQNGQYQWVITAHHANDSLETALLNLTRGTGLSGLKGIAPQAGNIIRPLLRMTRGEVLRYAEDHNIHWREDRSNASLDYQRNKIRHEVVPVLKTLNPALEHTFVTVSERLLATDNLLKELMNAWKREVVKESDGLIYINKERLLSSSEPFFRLSSLLQDYGFAYSAAGSILKAVADIPGKIFLSASHELLIDREFIILRKNAHLQTSAVTISEVGYYTLSGNTSLYVGEAQSWDLAQLKDKNLAFFNAALVQFPLQLRDWATGDTFCPFGMGGKRKKVSDLLTDMKLDRFQKQRVKVLVNGNGDIIWLAGIRSDERYKVDAGTRKAISIHFSDDSNKQEDQIY